MKVKRSTWYHQATTYDAPDTSEGFSVGELKEVLSKHRADDLVYIDKKTWDGTIRKLTVRKYTFIGSLTE
jgi:hypothetical protein